MFADVIIPLALPKNYTWSVPEEFQPLVAPGIRVEVVLGKNKKYAGLIKNLHNQKPAGYETKDILNVLDSEPVVFPQQLQLWEWIAGYYMCSEGEVMAAALPAHFKLSSETVIVFNEEYGEDFSDLDHDEYLIAEAILIRRELSITEVQQVLDNINAYPVIKKLLEKKVVYVWEALKQTYAARKETYITLAPQYQNEDVLAELMNNWKRAPKQMELLLSYLHLLRTEGEVTRPALLKKSGASDAQLKGLLEKAILIATKKDVDRIQYLAKEVTIDFKLSAAQQRTFEAIQTKLAEHSVCLLHGVTSSGKTQIYIRLMEEYVRQGKQVLYLLPEIALTSQIIRRLRKHFGGYIGIYHSKFSQNERIEIWNKIKRGELRIVLGARSALFLPFNRLDLIVIDEEHDNSYKQQDPAPRYHARDAAVFYASVLGAKTVMGSATPSVESFHNAITGKYGLAELTERFGGVNMPTIRIIDNKKIFPRPSEKVMISPLLQGEINNTLQHQNQVILFQNRRGYSPFQICQVCGWIPHCRNCDVTLTFHKRTNKLHCHYCGTLYPPVHTCQACGNDKFAQRNFGTEKIEETLETIFPEARIARMDVDSVRGKQAHDQLIQSFEQRKVDILVGTQMVVKGLDFDHVELVGILDADSLLNFADFRVNERAFQLMEQVSGRAGRKAEGLVAVQVTNTAHPVLGFVQQHDYRAFYDAEIESRKHFFYPPFSRLIQLTFKHKLKDVAERGAADFKSRIPEPFAQYVIGPAEPVVNRVRDQFLYELLFKLPKDSRLVTSCKEMILDRIAALHQEKTLRNVVVIVDVDS